MAQQDHVPSNHLLSVTRAHNLCFGQMDSLQDAAWSNIQQCIGLISKGEWYGWCIAPGKDRLCRKRSNPISGKWHNDGRRPGIEALIDISPAVDRIRSEYDEIRICAGGTKPALDVARVKVLPVDWYDAMLLRCKLELQSLAMST